MNCFDLSILKSLQTKISHVPAEVRQETVEGMARLMKDHLITSNKNIEDVLDMTKESTALVEGAWKELEDIIRKPLDLIWNAEKLGATNKESVEKFETLLGLRGKPEQAKYTKFQNSYHLLNQGDAVKKNLSSFLQRLGLRSSFNTEDVTDQFNEREAEKAQKESISTDHLSIDPRTLSKSSFKFTIGTLREEVYDDKGNIVPVKSSLGFTKIVPINKVQGVLLNSLNGVSNIDEMFDVLDKKFSTNGVYKKGYLWIRQLKNEYGIGQPVTTDAEASNKIAFEVSASKTSLDIIKSIIHEGYSTFMYPVEHSNIMDVRFDWQSRAKLNVDTVGKDSFFAAKNGLMFINRESPQYKEFVNTDGTKNTADVLKKLSLIGIEFNKDSQDLEPFLDELSKAYYALVNQLKTNPNIKSYLDLFESNEVGGRLSDLAKIYISLNPETKSFSFQNANGKLSHATTNQSTGSMLIDGVSQVTSLTEFQKKFPHLDSSNRYIQRSMLLSPGGLLFNKVGKKVGSIKYTLISGTGMAGSLLGKTTEDLGLKDRISQEINHLLDNTYYIGINADKSREIAMSLEQPFVTYTRSSDIDHTSKVWRTMMEDEMDAAFQEKISPSYIGEAAKGYGGYQKEVFNFGYFREILGPKLIESFNKKVINVAKGSNYESLKAEWIKSNFTDINDKIEDYIESRAKEYVDFLENEGIIEKLGKGDYHTEFLNGKILSVITGKKYIESTSGITLSEIEMRNLSRYLNINYEIARVEQDKLFYGHPSQYADAVKRLAMLHAPKGHFSQNQEVLEHLQFKYPRLDGRNRTTSTSLQFRAYKEPIYMQDGYDHLAEVFFKNLITTQISKSELEKALGAKFNEDGSFQELILKNGSPTGQMKEWLSIKGADSQVYSLPDHYWSFRIQSGNMNPKDWYRFRYDRAYEILDRSKRDKQDPAYKSYSSQLLEEARQTMEEFKTNKDFKSSIINNDAPRGVYKPQYFGYSDMKGLTHTVVIKMAVKPLTWAEVKGTAMEDAYIHHQAAGDDFFGFPSAEKVGVVTNPDGSLPDFYSGDGAYSKNLPPLQNLDARYLGIQTEVPVEKRKVIGSQVLKIIMSNTHPKYHNEVKEYINTLSSMYDHATDMVMKKLGVSEKDGEYYVKDVRKFVDEVRNKANGWGVTDNQIDSIIAVKMQDGTYQLQTKFDAMPSRERFENILWGMVNKKIVNREMYGVPAVQISELGTEKNKAQKMSFLDPTTKKIVEVSNPDSLTADQKKNLLIVSSRESIPWIENNKVSPAKTVMVWHETSISPRQLGMVKGKDGLWRDENVVLPEEFFEALGFRIPTDSMGSIIPIRLTGFFDPSEGDIATRSPGQIVKDGSDFDVDKFNMALQGIYKYNNRYFWNGDYKSEEDLTKRAIQVYEDKFSRSYNADKLFESIYEADKDQIKREEFIDSFKMQAMQNKLLKHMNNLLLAPENYQPLMNPIGMGPIPDVAEEVLSAKGISVDESNPTKIHQLKFSQQSRYTYLTSKKLVGIVARAATLHTMSQEHVANIKLTGKYNKAPLFYLESTRKKDFIKAGNKKLLQDTTIKIIFPHNKDEFGNPAIGVNTDVDGNLISTNISNSLQASVDAVKNPALSYLNINLATMPSYQYLIGKGVSPKNHALLFFAQPAIEALTKQLSINQALSTRVNNNYLSRAELVWKVASQFVDGGTSFQEYQSSRKEAFKISDRLNDWTYRQGMTETKVQEEKKVMFGLFKKAREPIFKLLQEINAYKNKIDTVTTQQLKKGILFDSSDWTKKEDRLFQASMLFFSEEYRQQAAQEFHLNQYLNLDTQKPKTFAAADVRELLFNKLVRSNYVKNPENIFSGTQLEALRRNLNKISPMTEDYYIGATPRMKVIMQKVLSKIDQDELFMSGGDKEDLVNKYQNFVLARVMLTTAYDKGSSLMQHYNSFLFGPTSYAKQLAKLKKKYPNSLALQSMSFDISEDPTRPDSIRLFKYETDTYKLNQITDSLLNLYNKGDATDKEFVKNLGIYSIIQSGLQSTRNSVQKVLPTEVYSDIVGKIISTWENTNLSTEELTKFTDLTYKQFHQLNIRQDEIVPKIKKFSVVDRVGDSLIALDHLDYSAAQDFIKGTRFRKELSTAERNQNELNGEPWKNFEIVLYEKINKGANEDSQTIWYKRINILGEQGKFTEVYPEDYHRSIIENNGNFDELNSNYLVSVNSRTLGIEEIDVPLEMENKQPQLFAPGKEWARSSENGYEVSTQGDKRFSALVAKLKDGRTIEEAYQIGVKGYSSVSEGKGRPPKDKNIDTYNEYKNLWKQWAKENPELIQDLIIKSEGKVLTDKFAKTEVSQARALAEIINETPKNTEYKVISGAQTGADMAGLDAALESGIQTGGTAAARFQQSTEKGNIFNPDLAKKYSLIEGKFTKKQGKYGEYNDPYIQRTIANAQEADGTVWFGKDSPGKTVTFSSTAQRGKPQPLVNPETAQKLVDWMLENNIKTLNVAGNREHTNPGLYDKTKTLLKEAFYILKETTTKQSQLSTEFKNLEPINLDSKLEELYKRGDTDSAPFEGGRKKTLEEFKSVGVELYNTLKALNIPDTEIFERIKSCL